MNPTQNLGLRRYVRLTMLGCLLALLFLPTALFAQRISIGSIAPENSPWGNALNELAAEWQEISNGRVRLRIFHNAVAGNEADVIRKMQINQLQGGVFTSGGLALISKEALVLSMPRLIRSSEELDFVVSRTRDYVEEKILERGFQVVSLSEAGWLRFFSDEPVIYPEDLKQRRMAASVQEEELAQVFRSLGYQPVPLEITELLPALNSGLADTFFSSPIAAGAYQWFALAPHMTELRLAPFLGAIVITDRAWRRVPEGIKPDLLEAAGRIEQRIARQAIQLEQEAISTMRDFGLETHEPPEAALDAWDAEFDEAYELLVGSTFDEEMYRRVLGHLEDFRN